MPDPSQSWSSAHRFGGPPERGALVRGGIADPEVVPGEKHPDYASSLNNLGVLHSDMGAYGKAESKHEEALRIRKPALGEELPARRRLVFFVLLLLLFFFFFFFFCCS